MCVYACQHMYELAFIMKDVSSLPVSLHKSLKIIYREIYNSYGHWKGNVNCKGKVYIEEASYIRWDVLYLRIRTPND